MLVQKIKAVLRPNLMIKWTSIKGFSEKDMWLALIGFGRCLESDEQEETI